MYLYDTPALSTPKHLWLPGTQSRFGEAPLPTVVAASFRTQVADRENCCSACTREPRTDGRVNLGVGLRGRGPMPLRAANGMEWAFTISGHRQGIDYDTLRRARWSLWQRVGGTWSPLEKGVRDDDTSEEDECDRPSKTNKIYVFDRPGWPGTLVPAAAMHQFPGFTDNPAAPPADRILSSPAATDVVLRASFAEWVQARSKSEGIPWTPLELPPLPDGSRRKHLSWISITWMVRSPAGNPTGVWAVGPRSVIRQGWITREVLEAAPV